MQNIGPIEAGEIKTIRFDFTDEVIEASTLSAQTTQVSLISGTDGNPSAILVGAPAVVGKFVIQSVQAGVIGATYEISAFVSDSAGDRHKISCKLSVSPN